VCLIWYLCNYSNHNDRCHHSFCAKLFLFKNPIARVILSSSGTIRSQPHLPLSLVFLESTFYAELRIKHAKSGATWAVVEYVRSCLEEGRGNGGKKWEGGVDAGCGYDKCDCQNRVRFFIILRMPVLSND
jgi:hypothetical protein